MKIINFLFLFLLLFNGCSLMGFFDQKPENCTNKPDNTLCITTNSRKGICINGDCIPVVLADECEKEIGVVPCITSDGKYGLCLPKPNGTEKKEECIEAIKGCGGNTPDATPCLTSSNPPQLGICIKGYCIPPVNECRYERGKPYRILPCIKPGTRFEYGLCYKDECRDPVDENPDQDDPGSKYCSLETERAVCVSSLPNGEIKFKICVCNFGNQCFCEQIYNDCNTVERPAICIADGRTGILGTCTSDNKCAPAICGNHQRDLPLERCDIELDGNNCGEFCIPENYPTNQCDIDGDPCDPPEFNSIHDGICWDHKCKPIFPDCKSIIPELQDIPQVGDLCRKEGILGRCGIDNINGEHICIIGCGAATTNQPCEKDNDLNTLGRCSLNITNLGYVCIERCEQSYSGQPCESDEDWNTVEYCDPISLQCIGHSYP